jgi:hypothetical protein
MRPARTRRSKATRGLELSGQEVDPAKQIVELRDEIDLFTAPRLRRRLAEIVDNGKTRAIVDLSEVTYIDSEHSSVGSSASGRWAVPSRLSRPTGTSSVSSR